MAYGQTINNNIKNSSNINVTYYLLTNLIPNMPYIENKLLSQNARRRLQVLDDVLRAQARAQDFGQDGGGVTFLTLIIFWGEGRLSQATQKFVKSVCLLTIKPLFKKNIPV